MAEFFIFLTKRYSRIINGGGGNLKKTSLEAKLNTLETKIDALDAKISRIDAKTEIAFLSKIAHLPKRSQLGQDLIAYALNSGKKDGFFVDIGAYDGVEISNSLLFEELGWRGFCVEANPKTFEKLRKNRKCDCYNLAVYSQNIGTTRLGTTSKNGLDSLELNITEKHANRMRHEGGRDEKIEFIEVQTATFGELMAHYEGVTHIDFLSLDIEGGELEVLKGIDFSRFSFGVMAIEHNYVNSAINDIKQLLNSKGYRLLMYDSWDFIFVPNDRIGWQRPYELKI
ncbi:FkbM family methyltransferase [Campylobacter troglodytis]|nr:FkbM family methyltransferase [Campylobacter troglodytis]